MDKDLKKSTDIRPSISFGSLGLCLLTLGTILARAFQPNAVPMSQWSIFSWVLMTAPVWLPAALGLLFLLIWIMIWIIAVAFDQSTSRLK